VKQFVGRHPVLVLRNTSAQSEYEVDVAMELTLEQTEQPIGARALEIVRAEAAKAPGLKTAVLATEDPEAVHNLRVSIRRIRSAIRALGPYLPSTVSGLDEPFHQLFEELGHVRDLDITCGVWKQLGIPDPVGTEVFDRLQASRAGAKLLLTVSLAKDGPLDAFVKAIRKKQGAAPAALKPSLLVAPDLVKKVYRLAHQAIRKLKKDSPPEDIHRVRRRVKRLRYTVEFFAEAYGKSADELIEHLRGLQDLLGEHQDSLLVARTLSELPGLSEEACRYTGQANLDLEAKTLRLRRKILKAAHDFVGNAWAALKKRMEKEQKRVRKS